MICSHYEVFAYDSKRNVLATHKVYSFDEAYYNIDELRELYPMAVEFAVKYPDEDIAKMGDNNDKGRSS